MDNLIGQVIDSYKIIEVLGRGGMGVVFKAMDLNLEKLVALKMIDPFLARDENFLKRFKTEAKALAKLENINIVSVYALRETEFGLFMVMEYVSAKTISEWIREKGRFNVSESKAISMQVLNAIGHAHKVGIIHRDIKPNNILLCEDGTVKVMDFGLAKVVQDHGAQNTVTQVAAGTLHYMSPEQIKGLKNVDNRSDIYAIGMTLYEMLAGRTPFERSESEFTIQKQIVDGKIPSPQKYNPSIPKQFVKFIMKSLEAEPDSRFQSVSEMQNALTAISLEEDFGDDKTRVISDSTINNVSQNGKDNKKLLYTIASVSTIIIAVALIYFLLLSGPTSTNGNSNGPDNNGNKNGELSFKPASLSINSEPAGADVMINRSKVGNTPIVIDTLKTEAYNINIRLSGYEQWISEDYKLFEGMNNLNVQLKPMVIPESKATLILNADPQGEIYVGNRKVSSTGETVTTEVTAGRQTVKFVHPQFGTKESVVNLSRNETKRITCFFQQKINIQSLNNAGDAFWGTIFVNGENTGRTTPGDIMLGPGSHRITVKKTGFRTREDEIVVNISPQFEPKSHELVFHLE